MSFHDARPPRAAAHAEARADALAVTVWRCAMAGFACGHAACWDAGWRALIAQMPLAEARGMFGEFHHFARTLRAAAGRPLGWRPSACPHLADDEAQVLRMIAAAQCGDLRRLQDVAAKLLLGDRLDASLEATQSLAGALSTRGLFVSDW